MIFYAEDYERWEDEDNPSWYKSMTPEICDEWKNIQFESIDDFYRWYYRNE